MIKNIIFDMDGVLIDSMGSHKESWSKALREHGVEVEDIEFFLQEGSPHNLYLNQILKRKGVQLKKEIKESIKTRKNELYNKTTVGAYNINDHLNRLRAMGIKIAVGSGGTREAVNEKLEEFFPGVFHSKVSGDDVFRGKPFPETYNRAIKLLGAKKEETIVVENAPLGIEAAKRAGLRVYAIKTTLTQEHLKDANKVFDSHDELFRYIFKEIENP